MPLSRRQIGDAGEALAEVYLTEEGYAIRERNFVSRQGEIDLIVTKGDRLFFVEVKWRSGKDFGSGLEAVSVSKQQKIRRTAAYYLLKNRDCQKLIPFFAVMAIDRQSDGSAQIEFLPDAFI